MRVQAADGQRWWVGRRWLPWRPKTRDVDTTSGGDASSALNFDGDEPIGCVIALVIGVVVLALPFILLAALFVAEWLLVLLLLPIITLIRVAWGMPWIVVARRWEDKRLRTRYSGQVRGWRASHELIERAASELQMYSEPRSLERRP